MRLLKAYLEDSEVVCGCGEKELRKNFKKNGSGKRTRNTEVVFECLIKEEVST
jgi:hypothetical protein